MLTPQNTGRGALPPQGSAARGWSGPQGVNAISEVDDIPGLLLWLRADQGVDDSTATPDVDSWTDQKVGAVFSQGTAAAKPHVDATPGSQAVDFDGSDDYLAGDAAALAALNGGHDYWSIFYAVTLEGSVGAGLATSNGAGYGWNLLAAVNTIGVAINDGGGYQSLVEFTGPFTGTSMIDLHITPSGVTGYYNGALLEWDSGTDDGRQTPAALTWTAVELGRFAWNPGFGYDTQEQHELALFGGAAPLATSKVEAAREIMAARWGITLA